MLADHLEPLHDGVERRDRARLALALGLEPVNEYGATPARFARHPLPDRRLGPGIPIREVRVTDVIGHGDAELVELDPAAQAEAVGLAVGIAQAIRVDGLDACPVSAAAGAPPAQNARGLAGNRPGAGKLPEAAIEGHLAGGIAEPERIERKQPPLPLDGPPQVADLVLVDLPVEAEAFGIDLRHQAHTGADEKIDAAIEAGARMRIVTNDIARPRQGKVPGREDGGVGRGVSRAPRRHLLTVR